VIVLAGGAAALVNTLDAALANAPGALGLALGWMAVMLVVGIGATTFASTHLEGVVRTVEHNFGRSFWTGVASQLAVLPVLGLTIAALALSVVGAVAIPVAIVVFLVALAGVATLGFLATAQLTGGAFLSTTARSSLSARDAARRGLVLGVLFYTGLWVAAAAFSGFPVGGAVARGVAFAATWVAITAGLGATVWSRAGTRVPATVVTPDLPLDDYEWSTPTPIAGVAAARRSAPTPQYTERT
jgi:hypothetical protein